MKWDIREPMRANEQCNVANHVSRREPTNESQSKILNANGTIEIPTKLNDVMKARDWILDLSCAGD